MNAKSNEQDVDRLEAAADEHAVLAEVEVFDAGAGERWGECPYCGLLGWLGYKDHCRECLQ